MATMVFERCIFIGDERHPEFREAIAWLRVRAELVVADNVATALSQLSRGEISPELIVVARAEPHPLPCQQIELLHMVAPLARLVSLVGGWCDGETSKRDPWPGVVRLAWHEFVAYFEAEEFRSTFAASTWSLPRTATPADRLAHSCRPLPLVGQGLVEIAAADQTTYDGLADACVQIGYATVWPRRASDFHVRGTMAGLWDDTCRAAVDTETLESFTKRLRPAPVIALLNFPRREELDRAMAAGAVAALAKPFALDNLLAVFRQHVPFAIVPLKTAPAA